jgi:hypothetical protein
VIFRWLARVAIGLALLALIVFNVISVIAGRVGTEDDASTAASAAATSYQTQRSLPTAVTAADGALGSSNETLVPGSVHVLADGDVSLTLRRKIDTVLLADIPGLKRYAVVTVSGVGAPEALP